MDLYSEIILDHFKNPHNKSEMKDATIKTEANNSSCGDKIRFFLKINDKTGKVGKATFDGEGCAISQASASMLTEKLVGKTQKEISQIKDEEIIEMLKIPISPARSKCALLALHSIKNSL